MTNLRLPGQYDERLLGSLELQGPYYNWNRWYLPGPARARAHRDFTYVDDMAEGVVRVLDRRRSC